MPMTVDSNKFNCKISDSSEEYIAYCGYDISYENGSLYSKDGVEYLIRAFYISINKIKTNIKLFIIGDQSEYLHSIVRSLNLENSVNFIGSVSMQVVSRLLCNAKILALTRPDNIQAKGGFPTKLGEYLATGKPVIVTKVGDIPIYLKDKVSAFLVEPGNINEIAETIISICNDYDNALKVGNYGRELTKTVFSYKVQGLKLKEYLENFYD